MGRHSRRLPEAPGKVERAHVHKSRKALDCQPVGKVGPDEIRHMLDLFRRQRRGAALRVRDRGAQGCHTRRQCERQSFAIGTTCRATCLDFATHQVHQCGDAGIVNAHVHVEQRIGAAESIDGAWIDAEVRDIDHDGFEVVTRPRQMLECVPTGNKAEDPGAQSVSPFVRIGAVAHVACPADDEHDAMLRRRDSRQHSARRSPDPFEAVPRPEAAGKQQDAIASADRPAPAVDDQLDSARVGAGSSQNRYGFSLTRTSCQNDRGRRHRERALGLCNALVCIAFTGPNKFRRDSGPARAAPAAMCPSPRLARDTRREMLRRRLAPCL